MKRSENYEGVIENLISVYSSKHFLKQRCFHAFISEKFWKFTFTLLQKLNVTFQIHFLFSCLNVSFWCKISSLFDWWSVNPPKPSRNCPRKTTSWMIALILLPPGKCCSFQISGLHHTDIKQTFTRWLSTESCLTSWIPYIMIVFYETVYDPLTWFNGTESQ